jgi:hypothetical protein
MGIIAGVLAITYTIIGLLVHFRGDFVQYFLYRTPTGIDGVRFDAFGIANHIGLIAALIPHSALHLEQCVDAPFGT